MGEFGICDGPTSTLFIAAVCRDTLDWLNPIQVSWVLGRVI